MNSWVLASIVACVLSFVLTVLSIPQIITLSFRKKLFDEPDARKIHTSIVPRLGGIVFLPSIVIAGAFLAGIGLRWSGANWDMIENNYLSEATFVLCAMMIIYYTGTLDDLSGLGFKSKFVVQTLAAILIFVGGLSILNLHGVLGINVTPLWLNAALTIVSIVFIINANNLIDGIDGLAAGVDLVACGTYLYIFLVADHYVYALATCATIGTILGFLIFNFGTKQRKIFMGDAGSLTLGMLLCIMSLKILEISPAKVDGINPLIIALAPLLLPCLDAFRVFFVRIIHKKNPFLAERNHIHHKLMDIGLNQRQALIVLLIISIAVVIVNVEASKWINPNIIILADILAWFLFNFWLSNKISSRRRMNPETENKEKTNA